MLDIFNISQPFDITLPNSHTILVTQMGKVLLHPSIMLYNTLLVTDFHCNLLNMSKLTQDSKCTVTFSPHSYVFQDQNQMIILAASTKQGGLYYFASLPFVAFVNEKDNPSFVSFSASVNNDVSFSKLWHLRLGHGSNSILEHVPCVLIIILLV